MFFFTLVLHDRLRRIPEHIGHLQVDWLFPGLPVLEHETVISGRFPYHVHRCAFAVSHPLQCCHVPGFNHESHALLRFVTHDLLVGKCRITHGQLIQMNQTSRFFHQFGQAIQMPACPVVMNRHDRVILAFRHRTNRITYPALHFRVGTLHGIQLDSVGIHTRIYR